MSYEGNIAGGIMPKPEPRKSNLEFLDPRSQEQIL
jgi:hypothetical protein